MAGYWSNVVRLARRESFGRLRLETPGSAAFALGAVAAFGALVGIVSGDAGYGVLASVAVIVATVLLFVSKLVAIPPRLAKEAADKVSTIQQQLDEISLDRPITYENLTLQAQRRDGNILLSGVTLLFRNASERTMHYSLKDVTLHVEERQVALQDQEETSGPIGHREDMEYTVAPLAPVEIQAGAEIIVDFNVEYDNQPPLRKRTTGRRVLCRLESLEPLVVTYVILEEREM